MFKSLRYISEAFVFQCCPRRAQLWKLHSAQSNLIKLLVRGGNDWGTEAGAVLRCCGQHVRRWIFPIFLSVRRRVPVKDATSLADVHHWSTMLIVVSTHLLCFLEDLCHLYVFAIRLYWATEFHLAAPVRCEQELLAGEKSFELFSMKVRDQSKYYFDVLSWTFQYTALVLLLGFTSLILAYYSDVALQGFTDNNTCA